MGKPVGELIVGTIINAGVGFVTFKGPWGAVAGGTLYLGSTGLDYLMRERGTGWLDKHGRLRQAMRADLQAAMPVIYGETKVGVWL